MERISRRHLLSYVLASAAVPRVLRGGIASQHFPEWYRCKTDIRSFLQTYFRVPGPAGTPQPYPDHYSLNILSEDRDNNRYLLKIGAHASSPETIAAFATHRLVFGSGVRIVLALSGNITASKKSFELIRYALRQLPFWMLANATAIAPGGSLKLPGGNQLSIYSQGNPFSDLLLADVDRVPAGELARAVDAAGYARVVLATSKTRYRSPVSCIELSDSALENFMGAFDSSN
jgi:hypothetical protein